MIGKIIIILMFQLGETLTMPDGSFAEYVKDDNVNISPTWSRSGYVVTVSQSLHGYSVGSIIYVYGSTNTTALPVGYYVVQTTSNINTYTILSPNSGTLSSQSLSVEEGYSWSRSGTTITVVQVGHIYKAGDYIGIRTSSDSNTIPAGTYSVVSASTDSYTFTGINTGATYGTLQYIKDLTSSGHITVQFPSNYFNPSLYQSHHRVS